MKVLITVGIFPPDIGGPATYVPRIASALAKRGHQVIVVAPREPGVPCPIVAPPYRLVRFHQAHLLRYANYFIELWRALVTILRECQACDAMFVNGLNLAATLVSRFTSKPMIVKVVGDGAWELAHTRGWTTLNLDEFQKARGLRIGLSRIALHAAAKRARVVITPSHYLARIVEGWGVPSNRIHVVYNAFVAPDQQEDQLPDVDIPPGFYQGLRLVTVGRLVPHKRISSIITTLGRMDDAKLVVVGDGPLRQSLQTLVERLALADRVFLTGRLPQEKVWSLLTRYAGTLILNSTYEGFPHILLEAAYFGVPIVATAVGGTPEIIQDGETGLLIPPDSPGDLLAALRRLQADLDLRHRLATNAQRMVARFSLERTVEETEKVLRIT